MYYDYVILQYWLAGHVTSGVTVTDEQEGNT